MKQILIFLALAVLTVPVGCTSKTKPGKPEIKIGVIVPFDGDWAFGGRDIQNGINLAIEEIRKKNTQYEYSVIFKNNEMDPEKTVKAAKKLIHNEKVNVLITLGAYCAEVIGPLCEENNILHIAISWDYRLNKKFKTTIACQTPVNVYIRTLADYLADKKYNKVAIYYGNRPGAEFMFDELNKYIKAKGLDIQFVHQDKVNAGTKKFDDSFKQAIEKNPDCYLLLADIPELNFLLKEFKEKKIKTPMTGSFSSIEDLSLIEGVAFYSITEPTVLFNTKFNKKFGHPVTYQAGNAYDAVNLVVEACEKGSKLTYPPIGEVLVKYLRSNTKDYPGAMGILNIGEHGGLTTSPILIKIENGSKVFVNSKL